MMRVVLLIGLTGWASFATLAALFYLAKFQEHRRHKRNTREMVNGLRSRNHHLEASELRLSLQVATLEADLRRFKGGMAFLNDLVTKAYEATPAYGGKKAAGAEDGVKLADPTPLPASMRLPVPYAHRCGATAPAGVLQMRRE